MKKFERNNLRDKADLAMAELFGINHDKTHGLIKLLDYTDRLEDALKEIGEGTAAANGRDHCLAVAARRALADGGGD